MGKGIEIFNKHIETVAKYLDSGIQVFFFFFFAKIFNFEKIQVRHTPHHPFRHTQGIQGVLSAKDFIPMPNSTPIQAKIITYMSSYIRKPKIEAYEESSIHCISNVV